MHHLNCNLCSSLNDYEYAFQKSGEGTSLPHVSDKLVVLYNLNPGSCDLGGNPPLRIASSRVSQLQECTQCGTFYLYRTDYEFLWGGTEDEQILERLTDEQAMVCLEKLEPTEPVRSLPVEYSQLSPEEIDSKALKEKENNIVSKLEKALAGQEVYEMQAALEDMDDENYYYPKLIPILQRIAGAWFYYFDDNGAGGFPRPDAERPISFKVEAMSAIEKIKKRHL